MSSSPNKQPLEPTALALSSPPLDFPLNYATLIIIIIIISLQ